MFYVIEVERFGDIIQSSELHRIDRALDRPVRCDHNHAEAGVNLFSSFQQFYAVDIRHYQITDKDINGIVCCQYFLGFSTVLSHPDGVSFLGKDGFQDPSNIGFVIYNEYVCGLFTHIGIIPHLSGNLK